MSPQRQSLVLHVFLFTALSYNGVSVQLRSMISHLARCRRHHLFPADGERPLLTAMASLLLWWQRRSLPNA